VPEEAVVGWNMILGTMGLVVGKGGCKARKVEDFGLGLGAGRKEIGGRAKELVGGLDWGKFCWILILLCSRNGHGKI